MLDGVSIEIYEGEFIAVMDLSDSGKLSIKQDGFKGISMVRIYQHTMKINLPVYAEQKWDLFFNRQQCL